MIDLAKLRNLTRALCGNEGRGAALLHAEDGMISLFSVITLFMFLILATLVANIGAAVNQKIEMQNAADAIATACTMQRARTLNTVTAANHLTGELLAIVALHEAIGCRFSDAGRDGPQDTRQLDRALEVRKELHDKVLRNSAKKPESELKAYDPVQTVKIHAVYTFLDGMRDLKKSLADVYDLRNTGLLLISFKDLPYVGPFLLAAGEVMYQIATIAEEYILLEWRALDGIGRFARGTVEPRDRLYEAIPRIKQFTESVLQQAATALPQTAKAIGEEHAVEGGIFPDSPSMKLNGEDVPVDINIAQIKAGPVASTNIERAVPQFAHAQVVRASYPWVNYHRQPFFTMTQWMIFSRTAFHYRMWTNRIVLTRCGDYYQEAASRRLYVIGDSNPRNKGQEPWTQNTQQANSSFASVGLALRKPPMRWAPGFFPQINASGSFAYAQSILYNANNQNVAATPAHFQPEVGWDTLNWQSPIRASNALEWPSFSKRTGCPRVRLNWQVKLVPVSRLPEVQAAAPAPFAEMLRKLDARNPLAHGH